MKTHPGWLTLSIMMGASVHAATAPASSQSWTLHSAVEAALSHSPSVHAAQLKLKESDGAISLASTTIFPTIGANVAAMYRKDPLNTGNPLFGGEPYNTYDFNFRLTQPLYSGGQLKAGLEIARKDLRQRELELGIARRDLTLRVIQAFYGTLLLERRIDTLKRNQAFQNDLLKTAQSRYRSGMSRMLEVLQIKTQLALLAPSIARAENDIQVRAAELAQLLGIASTTEIRLEGALEPADWVKATEAAKGSQRAIAELERAGVIESQAEDRKDFQLAKHFPRVEGVGTWGRSSFVKSDLLDEFSTYWTVGLQASIPIFSGLSSFRERSILAAQQEQASAERERVREQVSLEQIRAQKELDVVKSILAASRTALDFANEAMKEAKFTYRNGTSTYLQLYESQKNLTDAEFAYDQARVDAILAQARYFNASGWEISALVPLLPEKAIMVPAAR